MNMITIGGAQVDMDDPCAMLAALEKAELAVALGQTVVMTRFGEDEVRFSPANSDKLEQLIAKYRSRCSATMGGRRSRFAKRMRFSC